MTELMKCISTVQHIKQRDGTYAAIFPISTTNEVYFDIDKDIKLKDYLKTIAKTVRVADDTARFALTAADINEMDVVYVNSTNRKFFVIDKNNLNNEQGYSEIATDVDASATPAANKIAKFDASGKLHSSKPTEGTDVATYEYLRDEQFTRADDLVETVPELTPVDATSLNGIPASEFVTLSRLQSEPIVTASSIESVHAGCLYGQIPLECLPHGALERCVVVADDSARFALTTNNVQNGDTVKVESTKTMYYVIDETHLSSEAGYTEYTAGSATSVSWAGVTGKPTTLAGYGITDKVAAEDHTHDLAEIKSDIDLSNIPIKCTDYDGILGSSTSYSRLIDPVNKIYEFPCADNFYYTDFNIFNAGDTVSFKATCSSTIALSGNGMDQSSNEITIPMMTLTEPFRLGTEFCATITIQVIYAKDSGKNGFMSSDEKEKITALMSSTASPLFGKDNTSYGSNNFISGVSNSVGTMGFEIAGYSGINYGDGTYTLKSSLDMANKLKSAWTSNGNKLRWSLINSMNCDYFGDITSVGEYDTGTATVTIQVTNFFTNELASIGTVLYDSSKTYVYDEPNRVYSYAPVLGYSIQLRESDTSEYDQATIYICDYPALGMIELFDRQVSFGENNINQAYLSFTSGKGNHNYGKYGSIFGKNNKGGYNCHIFGRDNNVAYAQECIVSGLGNTVDNFANECAVFGEGLKASRSHKFVSGKYNKNLSNTVFEIGNGSWGNRKNVFDVTDTGVVSTNEKYLPNQLIFSTNVSFTKTDLLAENPSGLTTRNPSNTDDSSGTLKKLPLTFSKTAADKSYYGYSYVDKQTLGLVEGKYYVMFISLTISNPSIDISTLNITGLKGINSSNKDVPDRLYLKGLHTGENIITYIFTPTSGYDRFGIYFNDKSDSALDLTFNEIKVYELEEIGDIPTYLLNTPIDKRIIIDQNTVLKNAITQEQVDTSPAIIITNGKMYCADYYGEYDGSIDLYADDNRHVSKTSTADQRMSGRLDTPGLIISNNVEPDSKGVYVFYDSSDGGRLAFDGNGSTIRISGVASPTNNNDVATKRYVDQRAKSYDITLTTTETSNNDGTVNEPDIVVSTSGWNTDEETGVTTQRVQFKGAIGITANSIGFIAPSHSMTPEQAVALMSAGIYVSNQTSQILTFTAAFGAPAIDLPISIILL